MNIYKKSQQTPINPPNDFFWERCPLPEMYISVRDTSLRLFSLELNPISQSGRAEDAPTCRQVTFCSTVLCVFFGYRAHLQNTSRVPFSKPHPPESCGGTGKSFSHSRRSTLDRMARIRFFESRIGARTNSPNCRFLLAASRNSCLVFRSKMTILYHSLHMSCAHIYTIRCNMESVDALF